MNERSVSTWSLHRTLGRFVGPDSSVHGGPFRSTSPEDGGLALLDLPAELAARHYKSLQVCHFHLPSQDAGYLNEFKAALDNAGIALDAVLIDDGDLTRPDGADRDEVWIGGWLETAVTLGARRARICAGQSAPSPERLRESAKRLARLAAAHPGVRVVTENWRALTPDAKAMISVLDAAGDSVGLMIDLGNWTGPGKFDELAAIAAGAETSHAKCHFSESGPDEKDFLQSLQVLKNAGFDGPLSLIYDGPDEDEWANLDREWALVQQVFG